MPKLQKQTKESAFLNEGAIVLKKQEDGNWKGWMTKNGKELEVREIDPQTCLTRLLTHP